MKVATRQTMVMICRRSFTASNVRRLLSRLSGICEEIVNCPFIRGARKLLTESVSHGRQPPLTNGDQAKRLPPVGCTLLFADRTLICFPPPKEVRKADLAAHNGQQSW